MNNLDSLINQSIGVIPDDGVFSLAINFILCVLMSFMVRSFYIKYSVSLTGKHHIGVVIPILASIVFLVIVVVKSSLALSLGLVGALSIVRFRTPIKEPEELIYLFLAIAIGLGYAAGHTLLTTALGVSILIMIYIWLSNKKIDSNNEYNLVINWNSDRVTFENISNTLRSKLSHIKLIRLDMGITTSTAVLQVMPEKNVEIDSIFESIKSMDKDADVSFYEAKTNW
jgi:uncharacterized membrane protein YhiD involved in acid resistance